MNHEQALQNFFQRIFKEPFVYFLQPDFLSDYDAKLHRIIDSV